MTEASEYRRQLDLSEAVLQIHYASGGAEFTREYFCSYPAHVMVLRYASSKPGGYTATVRFNDTHGAKSAASGKAIISSGALKNGLEYETQVLVVTEGGSLAADGDALKLQNVDAFTVVVGAGTSYLPDYRQGFLGRNPHDAVTQWAEAAAATPYSELRAAHIRDYQGLFNRVSLDLGHAPADAAGLPTDRRLDRYRTNADDRGLEALLFQHGRYLLIASSRPGTLPANLQGIWNVYSNPPWRCDYHANINVQMNYWPAESTGLPECHQALLDYVQAMAPVRRTITAEQLKTRRSWAVRTENSIFGSGSFDWCYTANAWYAQHFWEHYAFGGDEDYLRKSWPSPVEGNLRVLGGSPEGTS